MKMLRDLGADVREVRTVADLDGLDGLVLPGGESTTMSLGIEREGLAEPLGEFVRSGAPWPRAPGRRGSAGLRVGAGGAAPPRGRGGGGDTPPPPPPLGPQDPLV